MRFHLKMLLFSISSIFITGSIKAEEFMQYKNPEKYFKNVSYNKFPSQLLNNHDAKIKYKYVKLIEIKAPLSFCNNNLLLYKLKNRKQNFDIFIICKNTEKYVFLKNADVIFISDWNFLKIPSHYCVKQSIRILTNKTTYQIGLDDSKYIVSHAKKIPKNCIYGNSF